MCSEFESKDGLCDGHAAQVADHPTPTPTPIEIPGAGWRDGDQVLLVDPLGAHLLTRIETRAGSRWAFKGDEFPARTQDLKVNTWLIEGFVHWVGLVTRERGVPS